MEIKEEYEKHDIDVRVGDLLVCETNNVYEYLLIVEGSHCVSKVFNTVFMDIAHMGADVTDYTNLKTLVDSVKNRYDSVVVVPASKMKLTLTEVGMKLK